VTTAARAIAAGDEAASHEGAVMSDHRRPLRILLADDDADDRELIGDALEGARLVNEMRCVVDGQELMDYLRREGAYADRTGDAPRPDIILLDLKMPRKDGLEALIEIRADQRLRQIPVVVLTTSRDPEDVVRSYDLGVNSFITKPATFAGLVEALGRWEQYWFELVQLPTPRESSE
jgi:CheY-like chemotaxis protein